MDYYCGQSGGALLGEGGYGCVFYPAINCKGIEDNNKNFVSKLTLHDKNSIREIDIGKKIQKIKNYMNNFNPVIKSCIIEQKKIKSTSSTKQCELFTKNKKYKKKIIILKMPYINGISLLDHMINTKNSQFIVNNIISSYSYLLKSIAILKKNKICHFDIKGDNILFDNQKKLPIIIDFGLSIDTTTISLNNLTKFFYVFAPEYYFWPLEVHYLNFLLHKNINPSKQDLQNIAKEYTNNNRALLPFSDKFKIKFQRLCYVQLKYYNNIDEIVKRINLLLNYWKTWDNYGISIMFLKIIRYIFYNNGFTKNKFITFFSQLLLKNMHPDPLSRMSPIQTLQFFNTFLNNKDINNISTFKAITDLFIKNRTLISKKITNELKLNELLTTRIML